MSVYTYVSNKDPSERTAVITLRDGSLVIPMGSHANITLEELELLIPRYNMVEGEVSESPPASSVAAHYGLDDLTDVDTRTTLPEDGEVLEYQASSGLWKPAVASSANLIIGSGLVKTGNTLAVSPLVVSSSLGEGAPAKGLGLNVYYLQVEGSKHIAWWRGKGAGEEPEQVADLQGIPANESVGEAQMKAALLATLETSTLKSGTINSRDAQGNPTSITQGGITTTYTWNSEGNPATETRGGHTKTYHYVAGVLTAETVV